MSLNLEDPRATELAAELSQMTGESIDRAVITALEERLSKERDSSAGTTKGDRMRAFV